MRWLPILCLWTGALLGFLMGVFLVGCREAALSRKDDLVIKPKRQAVDDLMMQMGMEQRDDVSKVGIAMDDVLLVMGSEGDNLPSGGFNLRAEVAEQLGCESPDGITFPD